MPSGQKYKRVTAAKDLLLAGANALQNKKRIQAFIDKHIDGSQGLGNGLEDRAQENNLPDTERDWELENDLDKGRPYLLKPYSR